MMTYSKMPLKVNSKWPKQFGFEIIGSGPCFVFHVEKGSVAYNSGLQPGDQILELDDQDVMNMSAEALKTLAKHSRTQPPTLGVVSRLLQADVVGTKSMGLGFTIEDRRPVCVWSVEDQGPAEAAGLRSGDIILEVNSRPVYTPADMKPLLASHSKRMSISFIPVGKQSQTSPVKKTNGKVTTDSSRVKRAKDLHDQMNEILGDDYEKKMAVVGVLKQYAEDRDIDMLARALSVILKTPHQRKLLKQIRPFIPPRQRSRFDDSTKQDDTQLPKTTKSDKESGGGTLTSSHKVGQRRALQIVRENGSFGFVIKGSNPAYIETVDPSGPAERAGLVPGDFVIKLNSIDVRKCSHSHLIHLLKDSGTAPIIEILRCDEHDYPFKHSGGGSSSVSSNSSHTESDWMTPDHTLITDKEGRTYHDRAEYLLTSKERSHIRHALLEYETTSNVVELYESMNQVLDTPSKKTLWMFIIARLPSQHQQYCINQINLPRHVLLECLEKQGTSKLNSWPVEGECVVPLASPESSSLESPTTHHSERSRIKIQSFQQQVEYLLTSRERSMLKKSLQLYSDNRDAESLVEGLETLLDTPSKRTLWMYIIPLLSQSHQAIIQQRIKYKSGSVSSRKSNTKPGPPYLSSEDDEHDLFSKSGARKMKSKPGSASVKGVDLTLIKELEETRRAVQEARQVFREVREKEELERDITRYITVIPIDSQTREPTLQSPMSIQVSSHPYHISGAPPIVGGASLGGASPSVSGYATPVGTFSPPATMRPRTYSNTSNMSRASHHHHHHHQQQVGEPRSQLSGNVFKAGHDITNQMDGSHLMVSKFSKMGGDTFNRHALTALKQLDAAMAAEVSDLENNTDQSSGTDDRTSPVKNGTSGLLTTASMIPPPPVSDLENNTDQSSGTDDRTSPVKNGTSGLLTTASMIPPPPVPPPPPLPMPGVSADQKNQMNVKRINWEKLDQGTVENTVWQQIGETEDLQDVVKYLELEQYFATKTPKQKSSEKRSEVCILNPKKSYNISILLGHLKLSLAEIRHALFLMDEEILTPELLKQLLAYAPSADEMERFDGYSGDIEELSQPDRFTYEMSRVPGYEQRLKALVFKGNFQEKIDEMKEHLNSIRKASLELRHSKKLSKILELILAMGNYMNQGNQRVGEAAGFKIKFLSQLEITKTADNKLTFLHVLAEAVHTKFPELTAVGEDLTTVPQASKFSNVLLNQELQELRKVLQDISSTLEKFGSQKTSLGINDNFQDVMGHFIAHASDEIQSLFRLNANTMEEFQTTVQYFGEDPKKVTTTELFGVFADFVGKFEKAHRHNIMYNRYT